MHSDERRGVRPGLHGPNPNLRLLRDLKNAGVEVFVCGQSLHELGFKAEEVAKEVSIADAAMLVLVNKQTDGYAYIPAR